MAMACATGATKTYVLKADRALPRDQQTRFQLRSLTVRQEKLVKDGMMDIRFNQETGDVSGLAPGAFGAAVAMVAVGCAGWDNLPGQDGTLVKPTFEKKNGEQMLDDASLNAVVDYIEELAQAIRDFNKLTEDDAGNSATSPASSPASENSHDQTTLLGSSGAAPRAEAHPPGPGPSRAENVEVEAQ